ncbi:endospore germination permease [Brevibacillus fortis]|uniref:Spore gernimation protein n=1 Tax=Brevibacillus fortis TaxID=2126352 RepID=A0A2P7V7U3_9BACL|nr:endospore germination permease [Brevibacillus fortis]MED1781782.1 endospore germination permease [Brevibacillus fortis]PSJ95290.1 spore gernimation protein [Brevibacillus fortis]
MRKYAYHELSLLQYILLIHGTQIGIGVLTLPRELAEHAGTDGWLSMFFGWGVSVLVSLVITNMMKLHPDKTITDLLTLLLGKWLGKVASILMSVYCAIAAIVVVVNSAFIINVWVLSQTPGYIIFMLFAIPIYIIIQGGLRIIARYSELVFYLTLWMPLLLAAALKDANWLHFLPIIKEGWQPILSASIYTVLPFLGFELAYFVYPFLKKKQHASLGIVVANTLTLLVYLHVTIICFAFFSPDEIKQYTWPTLNLWKVIEYSFLERIDIIFLAFYLFILSTTVLTYMYFAVFCTTQVFGNRDHRKHLIVLLLLIFVCLWFYTPSFMDLKKMTDIWSIAGVGFAFVLPVLLFGPIWLLQRKAGGKKA